MKFLISLFFLFFNQSLYAQHKLVGNYRTYFGERIEIYQDFTFKYTWRFDMTASKAIGHWRVVQDTIYFMPIFDTLNLEGNKDSLILSNDWKTERIQQDYSSEYLLGSNSNDYPAHLFYKRNKLYDIKNDGKLFKKRHRGIWSGKKYVPWYIKEK